MTRTIAVLIGGVLIGVFAMLVFAPTGGSPANTPLRDIADVPRMADAESERHRLEQYASLNDIAEVVALPSEFARGEAMFVIAGRSDSARVQKLIFDANRIADDVERGYLLEVLFLRLAELDPQSALALAQTGEFSGTPSIERAVWRAWGRADLDAALFAAKTQATAVQQTSAAQSLFAAFGFAGNETTDYIEAELGIGPDRATRSRYVSLLADSSIAAAIDYINGLERNTEQQEAIATLAHYIAKQDPDAAARYQDLFTVAANAELFGSAVEIAIAADRPREIIDSWLAGDIKFSRGYSALYSALRALAETDLDAAKNYYEQARNKNERQVLGNLIATEMAREDARAALEWARAQPEGRFPNLQMQVLVQIAQDDPQLALDEALKTPGAAARAQLVSTVLQRIAADDPAGAVAYLDQVQDPNIRQQASHQLASTWMRQDPDAALNWILAQEGSAAKQVLQQSVLGLVNDDVEAAQRVLPRLDAGTQAELRKHIAQKLAVNGSPGEAQEFIRQFQGQPDYDNLQLSVIAGVLNNDPLMARQMADQLADSTARDRAYGRIIATQAETDPVEATRWIATMKDEELRNAATAQVAVQWYARDPDTAMRWISDLPAGAARDRVVMQMSYQWVDISARQQQLIDSIADQDKRSQAKLRRAFSVARSDPEKARRLLDDPDISESQRAQAEEVIGRRSFPN